MILDKTVYRQVLGHFTTGVAVLTTCGRAGLAGLTINAFCSVSLDPPLVLVCIDRGSRTLSSLRESGVFVVNVLNDQQEHVSRSFATSSRERYDHFCHVSYWRTAAGFPVIHGVLAFIEARVVSEYPGGDHVILLGQVQSLGVSDRVLFEEQADARHHEESMTCQSNGTGDRAFPLLHYRGHYCHLSSEARHSGSERDKERLYAIIK